MALKISGVKLYGHIKDGQIQKRDYCLLIKIFFYYTKGNRYKFNILYSNYSVTTNVDQILQERERDSMGKVIYKRDEKGTIVAAKEKKGVPISDVWNIPLLNPKAKERTGYPTQKPIELLERI